MVEHTEKGPLIQYIDKSPEAIAKKLEAEKRLEADKKSMLKESKTMQKFMENLKNVENHQNNKIETMEEIQQIPEIVSNIEISMKSMKNK